MDDLVSVICEANDPTSPNFDEAQKVIVDYANNTPQECIATLYEVLVSFSQMTEEQQKENENTVFLIIKFIKQCFKCTIISSSSQNAALKTSLDQDLFMHLIEQLRFYFSSQNNVLRRSAVDLYSNLFLSSINLFTECQQLPFIIELINSDKIENVFSGLEFFSEIANDYNVASSDIFVLLTQTMEKYSDNLEILQCVIHAISVSLSSLEEVLNEEDSQQFILSIISHFSNPLLKKSVYNFYEHVACETYKYIPACIPSLMENSIIDLQDINNEIIFDICDMWNLIFVGEESLIAQHSDDEESVMEIVHQFGEIAEQLIPHFINCLQIFPENEISLSSTERYFSVYSIILAICPRNFPVILPFLEEQISTESETGNLVQSICLSIVSQNLAKYENIQDVINQIVAFLENPSCINTVYYCLLSLRFTIDFMGNVEPFLQYIDGLLEYTQNYLLCEPAMACFCSIFQCQNFSQFQLLDYFKQIIVDNLETDFPINPLLKCFDIALLSTAPIEVKRQSIDFLFNLLKECSSSNVNNICYYLPILLVDPHISYPEIFDDGLAILKQWLDNEYVVLPVICSLSHHDPIKFMNILPEIIEVIKSFLQSQNNSVVNTGINAFSVLLLTIDLSQYLNDLFPLVVQYISPFAPIEIQPNAIEAFSIILIKVRNIPPQLIMKIIARYANITQVCSLDLIDHNIYVQILNSIFSLLLQLLQKDLNLPFVTNIIYNLIKIKDTSSLPNFIEILSKIYTEYQTKISNTPNLLQEYPFLSQFLEVMQRFIPSS